MKIDTTSKTFRLVFSALMIALGTGLSLIGLPMPFGGTVTLASMVPLVVVCQIYGFRWGLLTGTAYGLIQMMIGLHNFTYVTSLTAYAVVAIFDYILAFGAISLSGLTRSDKKATPQGAAVGAIIGCIMRFICHFISGITVWKAWADAANLLPLLQNSPLLDGDRLIYGYSFLYNLTYMLPETVITAAVSALVIGVLRGSKTARGAS